MIAATLPLAVDLLPLYMQPLLFQGTAWYYARYRDFYPNELTRLITDRLHITAQSRILDLGCGPGHLALPLASCCAEVIGVDPDPEMLAEARRLASEQGKQNLRWIQDSSDNLPQLQHEIGELQATVLGRSFHWMKREAVLAVLDTMIAPSGGIMTVGNPSLWELEEPLHTVTRQVIQHWLGTERRAGDGTYQGANDNHLSVIRHSAFAHIEPFEIQETYVRDLPSILGHLYSSSFCSLRLLGDKRAGFEQDLRRELLALEPSGRFEETVTYGGCFAWRV